MNRGALNADWYESSSTYVKLPFSEKTAYFFLRESRQSRDDLTVLLDVQLLARTIHTMKMMMQISLYLS
jgi:hypothetical protein